MTPTSGTGCDNLAPVNSHGKRYPWDEISVTLMTELPAKIPVNSGPVFHCDGSCSPHIKVRKGRVHRKHGICPLKKNFYPFAGNFFGRSRVLPSHDFPFPLSYRDTDVSANRDASTLNRNPVFADEPDRLYKADMFLFKNPL